MPSCNVYGVEHADVRMSENLGVFWRGEIDSYTIVTVVVLNVNTIFIL